ncbi:MAG: hypothetical protein Q8L53_16850 [Aestuariivirga sp.]|nr:hypothetical protein [Aestuariivirga sp.]
MAEDHNIEYLDPYHDPGPDSMYPNLTRLELEQLVYLLTIKVTPARRVLMGFARAGIVLGAIPLLFGLGTFINYKFQGWPLEQPDTAYLAGVVVALSAILYGICYAVGWILSAFFPDS